MAGTADQFDPSRYATGGISKTDIVEMKRAFDIIDGDGSGSISPEELQGI